MMGVGASGGIAGLRQIGLREIGLRKVGLGKIWPLTIGRAAGLALAAAVLAASGPASAQSRADMDACGRLVERSCLARLGQGAPSAQCARQLDQYRSCLADRAQAPAAAQSARAAPRVQTDTRPLDARIFFLRPGKVEPRGAYYGYLIIGPDVSEDRKQAVAAALACRLQALPDAAAAAAVERLGLISLPAKRQAGATSVTPADVLQAYDFSRARRWLRAAGFSVRETFSPDKAVLFVASRSKRARQLDAVALAPPVDQDPVIADASALSAPYLGAWAGKVIDGLEAGGVQSRQDLQLLMEANSWLEWVQAPIATLMRISPALANPAPPSCPE